MSLEIMLLLGTLCLAMVLFSIDRIPADITALGILIFLILSGLLPAERAFAGFGSDVFIMVFGLLILMAALSHTHVTDWVGRALQQLATPHPNRLLLMVMLVVVAVGAFMSNTAATAFFLPIVIGLARNAKLSEAKFLMPLAFGSVLASSITLIGTSTNIVVSGLMTQYGLAPISMFELSPVGIPIAIVGIGYMLLLGRRFIPDRIKQDQAGTISEGLYFTEILIPDGSPLVKKTLLESNLGQELDLNVLRIIRSGNRTIVPRANTELKAQDVLLVEGKRENILRVKETSGVEIRPDVKFSLSNLQTEEIALTDVIIIPGSPFSGRTLEKLNVRNEYGLQILGIDRHGKRFTRKLSRVRLQTADILVLQGSPEQIEALEHQGHYRILKSVVVGRRPDPKRTVLAAAIFIGTISAATFGLLSLPVAMLLGALVVFATRCITPEEAYREINWRVLILIASMLGLGAAMQATGTAEYLAGLIVRFMGDAHPVWLLSGFFILTVILTQPMSNQAAAAVVVPIAIQAARQLGLDPRGFGIIIALAASCSFMTPLEPSCLLVYGPGRYRFMDFVKVGGPLTLLIYITSITLVWFLWPV
ncbi:MAG: SLC13 family permease [Chloroflexota bacterium]